MACFGFYSSRNVRLCSLNGKKSAEMDSATILKLSFEMLPYYILSFSLCIYINSYYEFELFKMY